MLRNQLVQEISLRGESTDPDHVLRRRRAMLEVNLHGQHIAPCRIELKFVVIAKPVEAGSGSDGANGNHTIAFQFYNVVRPVTSSI